MKWLVPVYGMSHFSDVLSDETCRIMEISEFIILLSETVQIYSVE